MAEELVYGFQCKVFFNNESVLGLSPAGTGTVAAPVWVELDVITDATLDLSMGEADASNRAAGGFELKEPILLTASLAATLIWLNDSQQCLMLLNALLARRTIDLLVLTGARTNPDAKGVRGDFKLFKFPQKQELKELVRNDITLMPSRSLRNNYVASATGVAPPP